MAKLLAILTAATVFFIGAHAAGCPPNTNLCGHELLDDYACATEAGLTIITPAGNDPRDCVFPVDDGGEPIAKGVTCCAVGRCFANGEAASCG